MGALKNIMHSATVAVVVQEAATFIKPLVPWLLFAVILTLADLNFGVKAARRRGEEVRFSRAVRRTMGKAVDYICWILLAGMADLVLKPVDIPYVTAALLIVVYGVELNSCYSNYFSERGAKVKVNVFRWLSKKTDIIEVEEDNEKKEENHDNE